MKMRNYRNNDLQPIRNILFDSLGYEVSFEELSARINDMLQANNYVILVAEENNNVIGFIGLQISLSFEDPGKVLRIIALAVSKEYQGKKIGTQLIKCAESYAKDNGIPVIIVNSSLKRIDAHQFYEKNLFSKKGYSFIKKV